MRWITRKALESEFGISWAVAEAIIRQECRAIRRGKGRATLGLAVLWIVGFFWVIGGASFLFPSAHHGMLALIELPGLVLLAIALLVMPRLLAADAILDAAQKACGDCSIVVPGDAAVTSHGADCA
jgi:hypothetical protein